MNLYYLFIYIFLMQEHCDWIYLTSLKFSNVVAYKLDMLIYAF